MVWAWTAPCTACTVCVLLAVYAAMQLASPPRTPSEIAFSYKRVVTDGEHWRLLTASLAHANVLHLLFNLTALWSCRSIETQVTSSSQCSDDAQLGCFFYAKGTLFLLVGSALMVLGAVSGYSTNQHSHPPRPVALVRVGGVSGAEQRWLLLAWFGTRQWH